MAIDRTTKFAFIELREKATTKVSGDFLRHLVEAVPYKVHTVLTDNGIHFTTPGAGGSAVPEIRLAMERGERFWAHAFEYACAQAKIEHLLTKPKHPWTNGSVERMNRTLKDATVKRYHYDNHDQLRRHLADFVAAYNFGRMLKTLQGLTPYEAICRAWAKEPSRFTSDPNHQTSGPNTCLAPHCDGASFILSRQEEDGLWRAFFTAPPARRRVFESSSKRRKRAAAPWPSATG